MSRLSERAFQLGDAAVHVGDDGFEPGLFGRHVDGRAVLVGNGRALGDQVQPIDGRDALGFEAFEGGGGGWIGVWIMGTGSNPWRLPVETCVWR